MAAEKVSRVRSRTCPNTLETPLCSRIYAEGNKLKPVEATMFLTIMVARIQEVEGTRVRHHQDGL
jgi:hypothetical protein